MTNMRQPRFLLRQQLHDCVAYPPVLEMLVRISPEIAQDPKIEEWSDLKNEAMTI